MKLLQEYTDVSDAEHLSQRLRQKGVLTYISSKQSKQFGAHQTGAVKVGVWVVLTEQENDAISLLSNKKHQVEYVLSEEQMEKLELQAKDKMESATKVILNKLLVLVLVLIAIPVITYYAL